MDYSQKAVSLPTFDELNCHIQNVLNKRMEQFVIRLCAGENLEVSDIKAKYLSDVVSTRKTDLAKEDQCIAITQSGRQCSRKKKDGSLYCGSHMKN